MNRVTIQGKSFPVEGYVRVESFSYPIPVLGIRMMEDKRKGGGMS